MFPHNIFLVGPMGAGKTTIGRYLANMLHKTFVDLDDLIEERCGADIAWIFDVEGEAGFRQRETALLKETVGRDNILLATGGGVVLKPENRELLKQHGTVVYLEATVEQLLERTFKDKKRPLLQVDDRRAVIEKLLRERDALYRDVADQVFRAGGRSVSAVAAELAGLLDV